MLYIYSILLIDSDIQHKSSTKEKLIAAMKSNAYNIWSSREECYKVRKMMNF